MVVTHHLYLEEEGAFVPVRTHVFPRKTHGFLKENPVCEGPSGEEKGFSDEREGQ